MQKALKIATFHKRQGDLVTFVRGQDKFLRSFHWHRIYISTLFTWELPRTIRTIKYYATSVDSAEHIIVGGIAATLMPDYIRTNVPCSIIEGLLDKRGMLGASSPPIAEAVPDYGILDSVKYEYRPRDAYFVRITKGCIRFL